MVRLNVWPSTSRPLRVTSYAETAQVPNPYGGLQLSLILRPERFADSEIGAPVVLRRS